MYLLIRRVWPGNGRPNRHHIHLRVRLFKQPALQARVDHLNIRRFIKQLFIGFTHQRHHWRSGVRLPAWVAAFCQRFGTGQFAERRQHFHHVIFAAVDQRADQAVDFRFITVKAHHADVQRGFHHAFHHIRVADHPVRRGVQQGNKSIAAAGV